MEAVGIDDYADYLDYLEVHPTSSPQLFDTILINVTRFFRDPAAWEYLRDRGRPASCSSAGRRRADPGLVRRLRVGRGGLHARDGAAPRRWAIEAFRERVKIYATDVDEDALAQRAPRRSTRRSSSRPSRAELLRDATSSRTNGTYAFRKDLRRRSSSAATTSSRTRRSRASTCCCRNTLMYFNAETQARILARFHFALRDDGSCSWARPRC